MCSLLPFLLPQVRRAMSSEESTLSNTVFRDHFARFAADYDSRYAKDLGNFRLERISRVATHFLTCGDYRQGVARIRCVNPERRHEYFRPFSCKGFFLCPSCSQKRTLLFAEYLDELTQQFAETLLCWRHSGFSVDNSVRLDGGDHKARQALLNTSPGLPCRCRNSATTGPAGRSFIIRPTIPTSSRIPPSGTPWTSSPLSRSSFRPGAYAASTTTAYTPRDARRAGSACPMSHASPRQPGKTPTPKSYLPNQHQTRR